jgi:O-antigen/teichoic acid export membrane protein
VALLLGKTFIESASAPLTNALMALERADITTASLAIGAIVTLGLGSIMIQKYGLNGAGIATVLSSAASAGWKWMAIRKILNSSATLNG